MHPVSLDEQNPVILHPGTGPLLEYQGGSSLVYFFTSPQGKIWLTTQPEEHSLRENHFIKTKLDLWRFRTILISYRVQRISDRVYDESTVHESHFLTVRSLESMVASSGRVPVVRVRNR
jgi:hypothetical protein